MLSHRDPLAKLVAAFALVALATLSEQPATFAVISASALAMLLVVQRVSPRRLAFLLLPFLFFAATSSWIYALAADPAHRAIAGEGWRIGALIAARIMTVGLVSILFSLSTDPADLVRALTQRWGVSRRFAYGALAAVQFTPMLAEEFRLARLTARNALGDATAIPSAFTRLRLALAGWTPGVLLILFAGAIRRASAAALAMEMRGLSGARSLSDWRRSSFAARDFAFLIACALLMFLAWRAGAAWR